jgi:FAD synthase
VDATAHGNERRPCAAVVGVWDPLVGAHYRLFDELRAAARERALGCAVVILDPDPVRFIWGVTELPVFNDIETRIALIREAGIDTVARVRFLRRDLHAGPGVLLDVLAPHVSIAELWLGARQTLGRGEGGSFEGIARVCESQRIFVRRLAHEQLETINVRELLAAGRIARAREVTGRPPIHRRPRSGRLRLAWRPGLYRVAPLRCPTDDLNQAPRLNVRLLSDGNRLPRLEWPDHRLRYLAFVAGPDD